MKFTKTLLIGGIVMMIATMAVSCKKEVVEPEPEPTPTNPNEPVRTYANDVQPIMFNFCITCHSGGAPAAGLDLSEYQATRTATETGNLINRINNAQSPMPQGGLMPQANRDIIQNWADNGYLE